MPRPYVRETAGPSHYSGGEYGDLSQIAVAVAVAEETVGKRST
jgi:hypothetical protein